MERHLPDTFHDRLRASGLGILRRAVCVQMVARAVRAGGRSFAVEPLGVGDAADMVALATLTRPGPFRTGTWRLGGFLGLRVEGRLVAMAGTRLRPDAHAEVSGVCTHPDYRGRGHAGFLMRAVASRCLEQGDVPFLHCYADNTAAIALYESLGFVFYQNVQAVVLGALPVNSDAAGDGG